MVTKNPNLNPSNLSPVGLTCVGQMNVTASASTSITTGTPTKLLGTTAGGPLLGWSHTNGRLTYEGSKRTLLVLGTVEAEPDNVLMDIIAYVALNGAIVTRSKARRRLVAAANKGVIALNTYVDVQRGDFLEIFVDSDVTNSLTAENFILTVVG